MDPDEGNKEGNPTEMTVERDDKLAKVCPLAVTCVEHIVQRKQFPITTMHCIL